MGLFRRLPSSFRAVAPLLAAGIVLAGCYMPLRFDAEIEIDRAGYYSMIFDGYMTRTDLFQDIREGKIGPAEVETRVEVIRRDLTRDPATTEFEYIKEGIFKVHWQREGDLLEDHSVTFVRRNEQILNIAYNRETRQISMLGKSLKRETKERLREAGLDTSGQIRVFSDANVTQHNATAVKPAPQKGADWKLYVWDMPNLLAPTPFLKIALY